MTNKFQDWLNEQMRRYGWDPSELARYAKISSATVTRITKGDRKPGLQTCIKLSQAFRVPVENVLRAAGYLQNQNYQLSKEEEWIEILNQLTEEERNSVNRICRGFILTRNR